MAMYEHAADEDALKAGAGQDPEVDYDWDGWGVSLSVRISRRRPLPDFLAFPDPDHTVGRDALAGLVMGEHVKCEVCPAVLEWMIGADEGFGAWGAGSISIHANGSEQR